MEVHLIYVFVDCIVNTVSVNIQGSVQGAMWTIGNCAGGPYSTGSELEGEVIRVDCCLSAGTYTLECINFTSSSAIFVGGTSYCANNTFNMVETVVIEDDSSLGNTSIHHIESNLMNCICISFTLLIR